MDLNIFFKKRKQNIQLEDKILRFIDKAESLKDSNLDLGIRFLRQADRLYERRGYVFIIESRINGVCLSYMDKYPPNENLYCSQ